MKFTADVERRGFGQTVLAKELVLTPSRWAWSDQGGGDDGGGDGEWAGGGVGGDVGLGVEADYDPQ